MSDQSDETRDDARQPIEETPEVAAAVADDTTAPQLVTGGEADELNPEFRAPAPADDPADTIDPGTP